MENDNLNFPTDFKVRYLSARSELLIAASIMLMINDPFSLGGAAFISNKTWYLLPLLVNLFQSLLLLRIVNIVSSWLDEKYDWENCFVERLGSQILLGCVFPLIVLVLINWLYLVYMGITIMNPAYSWLIFINAVIVVLTVNVIYYAIYRTRFSQYISVIKDNKNLKLLLITHGLQSQLNQMKQMEAERLEEMNKYPEYLILEHVKGEIKVLVSDIAYFFLSGRKTKVLTFENIVIESKETISGIESKLNPKHFFAVSRSHIISRKAYSSMFYHPTKKVTKMLNLEPEGSGPIELSGAKSKALIKWMNIMP